MKSIFKPENSIVAGLATVGLVVALYQLNIGNVSSAHATPPNHPALEASRKKAGWTSLAMIAGISLLARDPNIVILGGAAVIVEEATYRHAIMVHPDTGQIVAPAPAAYQPASG